MILYKFMLSNTWKYRLNLLCFLPEEIWFWCILISMVFLPMLIIYSIFQDLRESIDKKEEQIKKLKKALKIYAKRLKNSEGEALFYIYKWKSLYLDRWPLWIRLQVTYWELRLWHMLSQLSWFFFMSDRSDVGNRFELRSCSPMAPFTNMD